MKTSSIIVFASIMLASCHRHFVSSQIKDYKIKKVAIIPVEMIFTGTLPRKLTKEDIINVELQESKIFQEYLYASLLKRRGQTKSGVEIEFLAVDKTNAEIIEKIGGLRESWNEAPDKLAALLGVDAVVKAKVVKTRLMSDLISAGAAVTNAALFFSNSNLSPFVRLPTTTGDVHASCQLITNNTTLWNDSYDKKTSWKRRYIKVVDKITRKFSRSFPY